MQSCTACNQMNPSGFNYCGFCATPMENTELRAQIAEMAAPPGGWPNLTSELVEVRFYLQQGLFDDAYELLSILQKRHPGHPQLSELARRPKVARRVDTGVMALVDSVLAESANLVSKLPRRAATKHTAPAQGGADRTDVHSVVAPDDEPTTARAQRPKTGSQNSTRRTGGQPVAESSRTASGSHRSTRATTTTTRAPAPAEAPAPQRREPTRIYRAVEPPAGGRVAAQQPAATRPSPAAAPRSASAGARGEPSAPRAVVQAPAIQTPSMPSTGRASSTPRAPSAPAATVRPAATARAAEPAAASGPPPAVTGRTVISKPPQSGHTVVVDALQVPTPFHDEEPARRGGTRRRRDAEPAPAAAAPAPAASAPEPTPAPATEPKAEQPRRRATFGEHVLNRLR